MIEDTSRCLSSVCTCLLSAVHSHEGIKEILDISHQIKLRGTEIAIAWIPAHVGIQGNEEADRLARSIVTAPVSPRETSMSKSEIKNAMKHHCSKLWDERYKSTGKGAHYKIFQPSTMQNLTTISNRKTSTIIFRLQTGHCGLKKHLHRIGLSDSPNCDRCHVPETVDHFLHHCPQYSHKRSPIISRTQQLDIPFSLISLLTDPRLLYSVETFIQSTRRRL